VDELVQFVKLWPEPLLVVVGVVLAAYVTTRVSRVIVRRSIRTLASRSLRPGSSGLWRVRAARGDEDFAEVWEQRRRQRIEAASRMVNHLVSVVVWLVGTIVVFHLLGVNPAFFLSSAGFIGAGLAIGGQHKVNDYLTGLSVHFEDRYGIGDEIVVEGGSGNMVRAVVEHVGLFSTRLHDGERTYHFGNSQLDRVRNESQRAAISTLRLHVPHDTNPDDASDLLRGLAGSNGLTELVFLGDLAAHQPVTGEVEVEVRTANGIDDRMRSRLVSRAERALNDR
jgi:small-conductance mechanosensitive channel